jgi:hypothetical protein
MAVSRFQAFLSPAAGNAGRWAGTRKDFLNKVVIGAAMIKINSFTPADNFTRRSWEFHEDHILIKIKSPTVDYDYEVKYEKIKTIQSRRIADLNWISTSFFTVGLLALAMLVSYWFHIRIPNYWVIARILLIIPLAMLFLAFRRYESYLFIDVNNQVLTRVRVNQKGKQSLLEAIELIKQKTQVTNEAYFDGSLPNTAPIFQFTEYDFADFLNKSTVRVYEDKIICGPTVHW